jgi:hypothetical protein
MILRASASCSGVKGFVSGVGVDADELAPLLAPAAGRRLRISGCPAGGELSSSAAAARLSFARISASALRRLATTSGMLGFTAPRHGSPHDTTHVATKPPQRHLAAPGAADTPSAHHHFLKTGQHHAARQTRTAQRLLKETNCLFKLPHLQQLAAHPGAFQGLVLVALHQRR